MVFDKTWKAIQKDFKRLNPFDPPDKGSKIFGNNRDFDTIDTVGRGVASEEYEFKQLTYPIDLFTEDRAAHAPYMMIFINSRSGDSYNGTSRTKDGFVTDINENQMRVGNQIRGDVVRDKNTVVGTMGLLSTGLGGALGGAVGGIAGAGAGGAIGLAGGVLLVNTLEDSDFNKEHKRLKAAIALHMPNQLDIRYGMQYKNDNAANTIGVMNLAQEPIRAITKGGSTVKGMLEDAAGLNNPPGGGTMPESATLADTLKKGFSSIGEVVNKIKADSGNKAFGLGAAMSVMPGGDTLSAAIGLAPNPKIQSVFEGVDPRTFSYSYSFFPRNQDELDNIYRITRILKYHMHPSFKEGSKQFLFNYPSTFNIEFFVGSERNEYLHRHTGCVLTNLSIDYTPNGQYAYFNSNGAPIQINVRMDFRELEILTSDDIAENY